MKWLETLKKYEMAAYLDNLQKLELEKTIHTNSPC
jgi:hypothetical protein